MLADRKKKITHKDPYASTMPGFDPQKTTETFGITETPRSPTKGDRARKRGAGGTSDGTSRTELDQTIRSTSDGGTTNKDEDNYDITMRLLE